MSKICEWDQINEKIQHRAVRNLKRMEWSKIVNLSKKLLTSQFWNCQFKQVKWTLMENLIDINFMFIQENEQKILISYCLSSNSRLTAKNRFSTTNLVKLNLDQGLLWKNNRYEVALGTYGPQFSFQWDQQSWRNPWC